MKYEVMLGDYDKEKIGEIEADSEEVAYNLALDKFGNMLTDDGGWRSHLSVRIPHHIQFQNAVRDAAKKLEDLRECADTTFFRIFDHSGKLFKALFKALFDEIHDRSNAFHSSLKTGPDFNTYIPERLEYWEDAQKLLIGFKLPNKLIDEYYKKAKPATVFAIHIRDLDKESYEDKMLWNDRKKMAEMLNLVVSKITS
jgi:hypothetical protein